MHLLASQITKSTVTEQNENAYRVIATSKGMDRRFRCGCASAGMSVKEGEMAHVNKDDVAKFYPYFLKWGYGSTYQCIGLKFDHSVPETVKWGYWTAHMTNQRWRLEPNEVIQMVVSSGVDLK